MQCDSVSGGCPDGTNSECTLGVVRGLGWEEKGAAAHGDGGCSDSDEPILELDGGGSRTRCYYVFTLSWIHLCYVYFT